MLTIQTAGIELYDEETNMISTSKPVLVRLVHSLLSVSKWESIWEKPFIPGTTNKSMVKTEEELKSYVGCMVVGTVDQLVLDTLWSQHTIEIERYISASHSATVVNHTVSAVGRSSRTVTSELIYYWMIKFQIPFECERWHLNRLLKLIDVCNIFVAGKGSKLSNYDVVSRNRDLNRARREASGSTG